MASPLAGTYSLTGGVDLEPTKVRQQGQRQQMDLAQIILGAQQTDRAQTLEEKKLASMLTEAQADRALKVQQEKAERDARVDLQKLIGTQQMAQTAAQIQAEKEQQESTFEFQRDRLQEQIQADASKLEAQLEQDTVQFDRKIALEERRSGREGAMHEINMEIARLQAIKQEREIAAAPTPEEEKVRRSMEVRIADLQLQKLERELIESGDVETARELGLLRQRVQARKLQEAEAGTDIETRQAEADIALKGAQKGAVEAGVEQDKKESARKGIVFRRTETGEEVPVDVDQLIKDRDETIAQGKGVPSKKVETEAKPQAEGLTKEEQDIAAELKMLVDAEGMFASIGSVTGNQGALNALNEIPKVTGDLDSQKEIREKLRRVAVLGRKLGKGTWGRAPFQGGARATRREGYFSDFGLSDEEDKELTDIVEWLEDRWNIDVSVG